jgi:hypothetical protein
MGKKAHHQAQATKLIRGLHRMVTMQVTCLPKRGCDGRGARRFGDKGQEKPRATAGLKLIREKD